MKIPDSSIVPPKIWDYQDGCGFICIWVILHLQEIDFNFQEIYDFVQFDPEEGMHLISMATYLKSKGCDITFNTDEDLAPTDIEIEHYRIAKTQGLRVKPALSLQLIGDLLKKGRLSVILMDTLDACGHLDIVTNVNSNIVSLYNYCDMKLDLL